MLYDETFYARFLNGELNESEVKQLKENGDWEVLNKIIEATDELTLPPLETEASFLKLLEKKKSERKGGNIFRLTFFKMVVAASILLCFTSYYMFFNWKTTLSAGNNEVYSHTFKDGSIVELNDGSSLAFLDKKWSQKREVELTGEALFEVNKGVPFQVETKNGMVLVLGTKFNVRSWGQSISVECYSGVVELKLTDKSYTINAGQAVDVYDTKVVKQRTHNNVTADWLSGTSRFYNENIDMVLEEMARQYDIKIEKSITLKRFSGAFTHDSLELALKEVTDPLGMEYEIIGDKNLVKVFE